MSLIEFYSKQMKRVILRTDLTRSLALMFSCQTKIRPVFENGGLKADQWLNQFELVILPNEMFIEYRLTKLRWVRSPWAFSN